MPLCAVSCRPLSNSVGCEIGYRLAHISIPRNRTPRGRRLCRFGLTDSCGSHPLGLCLSSTFVGLGFSFPYCAFIIVYSNQFVKYFFEYFLISFVNRITPSAPYMKKLIIVKGRKRIILAMYWVLVISGVFLSFDKSIIADAF